MNAAPPGLGNFFDAGGYNQVTPSQAAQGEVWQGDNR
jgi:hypothetical protein